MRLGRFPNNGEWKVETLNVSLSNILESDFHINLISSFKDVQNLKNLTAIFTVEFKRRYLLKQQDH